MRIIKKLAGSIVLLVLLSSILALPAHAFAKSGAGSLEIDNSTLYDDEKESDTNSITFRVPNLFLDEVTKRVKRNDKKRAQKVKTVQREVFSSKRAPKKSRPVVVQRLFAQNAPAQIGNQNSLSASSGALPKMIAIVIGAIALLSLGVFLGKRFSTITQERSSF